MGEAVENLIALASAAALADARERSDVSKIVRAHTRVQNGRVVHVTSYTRAPGAMSKAEIEQEIAALRKTVTPDERAGTQNRARLTALLREAAGRQRAGTWGNDNRDSLNSRNTTDANDERADLLSQRGGYAHVSFPAGHPMAPKPGEDPATAIMDYLRRAKNL